MGGWQALQQARTINRAGRVSEAAYLPPFLRGKVREGDTEYQSGLEIHDKSKVENLCRCRESQRWGKICAHSLAVGIAILKPVATSAAPDPAAAAAPGTPVAIPAAADGLRFEPSPAPGIGLHVVLPPNLPAAWDRGQISVIIEAGQGSRRSPVNALREGSYGVDEADARLIAELRQLNGGKVAGLLSLPRAAFCSLLTALRDHPRVTLARKQSFAITSARARLIGAESPDGALDLAVKLPPHDKLLADGAWVWGTGVGPAHRTLPRCAGRLSEHLSGAGSSRGGRRGFF